MKRVRVSIDGRVVQEVDADRELTIGRSKEADVRIADKQISSRHVSIRPRDDGSGGGSGGGGLEVADLGSTNGCVMDGGHALVPHEYVPFERGNKLTVGPAIVEVVEPEERPESSVGFSQDKTMVVGGGLQQSLLVEIARFQAARARLVIAADHARKVLPMEEMEVTIGRDRDCQVVIDHPSVSGKHAQIAFAEGKFTVEDLKSGNGTQLDGEGVTAKTELAEQAHLKFGTVDALFCRAPAEKGTQGGGEGEFAAVLAHHAAAQRMVTRHQAEQALAEHRDQGASVGEVFVREGTMAVEDWVGLWKLRREVRLLGTTTTAAASSRSGGMPVWLIWALLGLSIAAAAYFATR